MLQIFFYIFQGGFKFEKKHTVKIMKLAMFPAKLKATVKYMNIQNLHQKQLYKFLTFQTEILICKKICNQGPRCSSRLSLKFVAAFPNNRPTNKYYDQSNAQESFYSNVVGNFFYDGVNLKTNTFLVFLKLFLYVEYTPQV